MAALLKVPTRIEAAMWFVIAATLYLFLKSEKTNFFEKIKTENFVIFSSPLEGSTTTASTARVVTSITQ